ncbi:MAG: type II toxin-antitoxin system VapC family toxin [Candidatus Sulfotelmatobacter sp.]
MKRFVLDASVALAWFIDRSIAPYATAVRKHLLDGSRAVVPALWQLEVVNGFVIAERRGVLTSAEAMGILQNFEIVLGQSIEIRHEPVSMRRIIATAREFRLTAYDAAYLDLAREQQLPIATLDPHLVEAATRASIPLLP